jgi:hypothetical protein
VEVKLRNKKKPSKSNPTVEMQINEKNGNGQNQEQVEENGHSQQPPAIIGSLAVDTAALLHRTMEALYEMNPDLENSHEGWALIEE